MSWIAVGSAAVGVIGGIMGNRSASKGADAAARAQMAAIEEQRRQYDQTRTDSMPWLQAGQNALGGLQGLLSDPNSIQDSNAYQFRFNQQLQGLDRSAAKNGSLYSGGHRADLMNYSGGLASQEFGNQWNRLAGLAGVGQATASNLGQLGQQSAGNIGNALGNIGQIRQSSYQQIGNNNAQMVGAIGGAFNNWNQNRLANLGRS